MALSKAIDDLVKAEDAKLSAITKEIVVLKLDKLNLESEATKLKSQVELNKTNAESDKAMVAIELSKSKAEVIDVSRQIDAVKVELVQSEGRLSIITNTLADYDDRAAQAQAKVDALLDKVVTVKNEYMRVVDSQKELKDSFAQEKADHARIIEDLVFQADKLKKDISILRESTDKAQAIHTTKVERLRTAQNGIQKELETVESKLEHSKVELLQVDEQKQKMEKEINNFGEYMTSENKKLESREIVVARREQEMGVATRKLDTRNSIMGNL